MSGGIFLNIATNTKTKHVLMCVVDCYETFLMFHLNFNYEM